MAKNPGKITNPNEMKPCNRCGGQHKQYQSCNIESRIIELTREKQRLAERCEQLERKQAKFDAVVCLLANTNKIENLLKLLKKSNDEAT